MNWLGNTVRKEMERHEACPAVRREGEGTRACEDVVASETAIALVYNGQPYAVMMATPGHLEDFALGFSLSEGIVRAREEFRSARPRIVADGIELAIEIDPRRQRELARKQRSLAGRVGCGLCGAQTIAQAIRKPPPVEHALQLTHEAIRKAIAALPSAQPLNSATGAVHAAAWANDRGEIELVREDVGRHNALDKLIGARLAGGRGFDDGFAMITSRASHEMVQKAATVGIEALVAFSAPTTLAIRVAQKSGVTLVAFARETRHTVYAGAERFIDEEALST